MYTCNYSGCYSQLALVWNVENGVAAAAAAGEALEFSRVRLLMPPTREREWVSPLLHAPLLYTYQTHAHKTADHIE